MAEVVGPNSEPPYQPPYAPPYQPPYRAARLVRRGMSAESLTTLFGVLLGLTLFIGLFCYHAIFLIPVPCTSPGGCGTVPPELQAYDAAIRILSWIAFGVIDASVAFAVTAAYVIGASRSAISEGVRRGMFLYASVFVFGWLVFSTFLLSALFGTFLRFI